MVIVVPSGREAEDLVGDLRSWYDGDPNEVAQLMAWETLPHERLSPRADTVANRMETFYRLCHPQSDSEMFGPIRILVMPVRSLIQPVVAGIGDVKPLVFAQGEEITLEDAVQGLVRNSYTRVDLVMDRGEFAVRGGIIDVFVPTEPHPVRIEFFGDEIDTIRRFHSSDQRTYGEPIRSVWATPCRELQLTEGIRERAQSLIGRFRMRRSSGIDSQRNPAGGHGVSHPGIGGRPRTSFEHAAEGLHRNAVRPGTAASCSG